MSQTIKVTVDEEGRIRLPAETLRALGLAPGMTLVIEETPEGEARLSIQEPEPSLVDKGGVLVVQGELLEEIGDVVRRERDGRVEELVRRVGL